MPLDEHVRTWNVDFAMSWASAKKDYTSIIYTGAGIQSHWQVEKLGLDGHCYARYVATSCELRPAAIESTNMSVANTSAATNAATSLPLMGFTFEDGHFAEDVSVTS